MFSQFDAFPYSSTGSASLCASKAVPKVAPFDLNRVDSLSGLNGVPAQSVGKCHSVFLEELKDKSRKKTKQGRSFKICAKCKLMARSNNQHACPPPSRGGCGAKQQWQKAAPNALTTSKKRKCRTSPTKQPRAKRPAKLTKTNDFSKWLETEMSLTELEASEFKDSPAVPKLVRGASLVPVDEYDESMYDESPLEIVLKSKVTERDNTIKELQDKAMERANQIKKLQADAVQREIKIKQLLAQDGQREMDLKLREVALKRREIDLEKREKKKAERIAVRESELECLQRSLVVREVNVGMCEVLASDEDFLLMNDALLDFPVEGDIFDGHICLEFPE